MSEDRAPDPVPGPADRAPPRPKAAISATATAIAIRAAHFLATLATLAIRGIHATQGTSKIRVAATEQTLAILGTATAIFAANRRASRAQSSVMLATGTPATVQETRGTHATHATRALHGMPEIETGIREIAIHANPEASPAIRVMHAIARILGTATGTAIGIVSKGTPPMTAMPRAIPPQHPRRPHPSCHGAKRSTSPSFM